MGRRIEMTQWLCLVIYEGLSRRLFEGSLIEISNHDRVSTPTLFSSKHTFFGFQSLGYSHTVERFWTFLRLRVL